MFKSFFSGSFINITTLEYKKRKYIIDLSNKNMEKHKKYLIS